MEAPDGFTVPRSVAVVASTGVAGIVVATGSCRRAPDGTKDAPFTSVAVSPFGLLSGVVLLVITLNW